MSESRSQKRLRTCWKLLEDKGIAQESSDRSQVDWPAVLTLLKKTVGHIHTDGLVMALLFVKTRGQHGKTVYDLFNESHNEFVESVNHDLLKSLREGDLAYLTLATDGCVEAANVFCWYLQGAGIKARPEETNDD